MKEVVLELDLFNDKAKKKALRTVSGLPGVDSISLDKDKLTVTGAIDPVQVASKLRKNCKTNILSVGPTKESDESKGETKTTEDLVEHLMDYRYHTYNSAYMPAISPYGYTIIEEHPNGCVIC